MKKILIILDGLMEKSFETRSFKDIILKDVNVQTIETRENFCVHNKDIDSLNCIMNMLGYNPNKIEIGDRSYYEAISKGINLKENQYVLRCNIVKCQNNKITDFTGGHLPYNIENLVNKFKIENGYIYHCYKYKNLIILNEKVEDRLYPPHFNLNKDINEIIPKNKKIQKIINDSYKYFEYNKYKGLMFWIWGQSGNVNLPPYKKTTTMIAGIDLLIGIGKALKMNTIMPEGCNGDTDSKLNKKLESTLLSINNNDNVIVHINGFDEASHRRNAKEKLEFINKFRKDFLNPLIKETKKIKNVKIDITCDHRTNSSTGYHEDGFVPKITILPNN